MNIKLKFQNSSKGFTTMELVVSVGIFSLIVLAAAWLVIDGFRSNAVIWEQLATQSDGRKILKQITDEARSAVASNIGSYPIELAGEYEFIFYANIDGDALRERVRFWLDGKTLKKEVTKPEGDQLVYNPENGITTELAHNIANLGMNSPVFSYYDENYTGAGDPLEVPVDISAIRLVRVQFELEKDPSNSPVPFRVESFVHIRNLKEN